MFNIPKLYVIALFVEEQKQSYCQHSIGVIMSEAYLQEPQSPSTSYQLYSGSCLPPGADSHLLHECWNLPHGHPKAARQAIQSSDSSRHLRISIKHYTSGLGLQHPKRQLKGPNDATWQCTALNPIL